jgi:hypothetical protein
MKAQLTVFCLFAALTAGAQSTTEHLPTTDAERIADALRAAPKFITDGATIMDYPAIKGGEWRVLRKGTGDWTCLPGPPPGSQHDDPGCLTTDASIVWFAEQQAAQAANPAAPKFNLQIIMGPAFGTMLANLAQHLRDGRLRTVQGVYQAGA